MSTGARKRHSGDANPKQRLFHGGQSFRSNHGHDELHQRLRDSRVAGMAKPRQNGASCQSKCAELARNVEHSEFVARSYKRNCKKYLQTRRVSNYIRWQGAPLPIHSCEPSTSSSPTTSILTASSFFVRNRDSS